MKNSEMVPNSRNGIGTRLTALVAKAGGITEVTEKTGWAVSSLRRWMNGETAIKLEDAQELCGMTDSSLEWLASGSGAVTAAGSDESGLSVVPGDDGGAALAVPAGLLNGGRAGCKAYQVHGDAMLPSLPPGSTVVVDSKQAQLLDGQVYMLTLGGAVLPHDVHSALVLVFAAAVHKCIGQLRVLEAPEQLDVATFPESVELLHVLGLVRNFLAETCPVAQQCQCSNRFCKQSAMTYPVAPVRGHRP